MRNRERNNKKKISKRERKKEPVIKSKSLTIFDSKKEKLNKNYFVRNQKHCKTFYLFANIDNTHKVKVIETNRTKARSIHFLTHFPVFSGLLISNVIAEVHTKK